jgi:hypothetical protein
MKGKDSDKATQPSKKNKSDKKSTSARNPARRDLPVRLSNADACRLRTMEQVITSIMKTQRKIRVFQDRIDQSASSIRTPSIINLQARARWQQSKIILEQNLRVLEQRERELIASTPALPPPAAPASASREHKRSQDQFVDTEDTQLDIARAMSLSLSLSQPVVPMPAPSAPAEDSSLMDTDTFNMHVALGISLLHQQQQAHQQRQRPSETKQRESSGNSNNSAFMSYNQSNNSNSSSNSAYMSYNNPPALPAFNEGKRRTNQQQQQPSPPPIIRRASPPPPVRPADVPALVQNTGPQILQSAPQTIHYPPVRLNGRRTRPPPPPLREPALISIQQEACSICTDPIIRGHANTWFLTCGHSFHSTPECLPAWLQRERKCPVCRTDVPPA